MDAQFINQIYIMKKHYLLLSAMVTAVSVGIFSIASSSGQSQALAGSPISGGSTCTGCHAGTVNSGPGTIELNGLPAEYMPGTTYSLTLAVTGESSSRLGFQTVVLDGSNNEAGSFTNLSTNVGTFTNSGATFLEHTSPSSTGSWTFDWTAPAAGTGEVTFYTAINATNGNFVTTGDNVYNERFVLAESDAASVSSLNRADLKLFPVPAKETLFVQGDLKNRDYEVFNLNGQVVKQGWLMDEVIDLNELSSGTYILRVGDINQRFVKF